MPLPPSGPGHHALELGRSRGIQASDEQCGICLQLRRREAEVLGDGIAIELDGKIRLEPDDEIDAAAGLR